jgi:hypothetical protein
MNPIRRLQAALLGSALVIAALAALPVSADSVQLANGDVLNGKVLSLDDKQLRLESDTLGQVNIARVKIVAIMLGDQKAPKAGTSSAAQTPEAVLKQLQLGGVNPKDVSEIQKLFPLLATPEASQYFNDTVKGLLAGTRSVDDIRKEAIRARDELKKMTKGLGPDVESSVAPYLSILEKFIGETAPTAKKPKADPPPKK